MERKPRPRDAHIFDTRALLRTFAMGTIIGIAALSWCFLAWSGYGWQFGMSSVPDSEGYRLGTTLVPRRHHAGAAGHAPGGPF